MSIEAYQAVWSFKGNGFTTNLRCTLLSLAEFASKNNGYTCCASVTTIAEMLDTRPRQAQRNLAYLESLGLIKIIPNRGRGNTNVYDLTPIMEIKGVMGDVKPVTGDTFTDKENTSSMTGIGKENTSSVTPFNEETPSSMTGFNEEKVSSGTIKPVMDDTQTIYKENTYIYGARKTNGTNGFSRRPPEKIVVLIEAIRSAVKTPYDSVSEPQFEDAAYEVEGWNGDVSSVAGFCGWWERNRKYPGLPALKTFRAEFRNYLKGIEYSAGKESAAADRREVTPAVDSAGGYYG